MPSKDIFPLIAAAITCRHELLTKFLAVMITGIPHNSVSLLFGNVLLCLTIAQFLAKQIKFEDDYGNEIYPLFHNKIDFRKKTYYFLIFPSRI